MALIQAPNSVVMIRPWHFHPNPETAGDNAFQKTSPGTDINVSQQARAEFDKAVEALHTNGVRVHVFDDYGERETPDSVFPNNWFSTHQGGHVALFSMFSPSRRRERRSDVIEMLKSEYRIQDVVDYSGLEWDGLFLEGTGAMVLDHIERVAYTASSNRANDIVLERFCSHFQYEPMAFDTADENGNAIYHTNVMMCIATKFALVCLNMISDRRRRAEVKLRLENSGRTVVDLDFSQVNNFAGNALELTGNNSSLLAMSARAYQSLRKDQVKVIEASARILSLSVPTIELAGGSVRCMLTGIHLSRRDIASSPKGVEAE
jgi:hypothetical protein